ADAGHGAARHDSVVRRSAGAGRVPAAAPRRLWARTNNHLQPGALLLRAGAPVPAAGAAAARRAAARRQPGAPPADSAAFRVSARRPGSITATARAGRAHHPHAPRATDSLILSRPTAALACLALYRAM